MFEMWYSEGNCKKRVMCEVVMRRGKRIWQMKRISRVKRAN